MEIQEKYQRAVEGFVKKAIKRYKDKIESIILFGSVARGDAKEDSDVDILVIIKETFMTHRDTREHENNNVFSYQRNIEDMKEIYGIAFVVSTEHSKDISPKIYAIDEVLNRIEIGAPFIKEVLKEGVSL